MRPATGGMRPTRVISRVEGWLRERFLRHPYIYFGVSGTTLLHEALKNQSQRWVVLPGFLCPNISAAAARAGNQLAHIDANRHTQLPDMAQLEYFLARHASNAVVLIDHSFGYPFPAVAQLRREYPKLLIIEDCARALGVRINGQFPGEHSDLILVSMYKTIPGSKHGAALLSNTPLPILRGHIVPATLRERIATVKPLRSIYRALQSVTSEGFSSRLGQLELRFPDWSPTYGFPNDLCLSRFADELMKLDIQMPIRTAIAEELTDSLSDAGVDCIRVAEGCQSAGHFVSFAVPHQYGRDEVLTRLSKKSLPMGRSWDIVAAHYRSFQETFPAGHSNSEYLAEHMVHIRLSLYPNRKQRQRLVRELRELTAQHGSESKNIESHLPRKAVDS